MYFLEKGCKTASGKLCSPRLWAWEDPDHRPYRRSSGLTTMYSGCHQISSSRSEGPQCAVETKRGDGIATELEECSNDYRQKEICNGNVFAATDSTYFNRYNRINRTPWKLFPVKNGKIIFPTGKPMRVL